MNRYSNIVNLTKFGKRRVIPEVEPTSSVQVNSIHVASINGVSVKEVEQETIQQNVAIDTNKQDIALLQNRVVVLEGYVSELQQIIWQLRGR